MKNVNGMKNLNVKVILMLLAIFAISIQSIEVEAKTEKQSTKDYSKNWEGEWTYGKGQNTNYGILTIKNCNNNVCEFRIYTISGPTWHECDLYGKIIINNLISTSTLEFIDYKEGKNKKLCNIVLGLEKDLSSIKFDNKNYCYLNFCGSRGRIDNIFYK